MFCKKEADKSSAVPPSFVQGASAGGFPRVVSGAGGAGDLQGVSGADGRPPPALLPRRRLQGPEPRVTSAAATARGLEGPLEPTTRLFRSVYL